MVHVESVYWQFSSQTTKDPYYFLQRVFGRLDLEIQTIDKIDTCKGEVYVFAFPPDSVPKLEIQ